MDFCDRSDGVDFLLEWKNSLKNNDCKSITIFIRSITSNSPTSEEADSFVLKNRHFPRIVKILPGTWGVQKILKGEENTRIRLKAERHLLAKDSLSYKVKEF